MRKRQVEIVPMSREDLDEVMSIEGEAFASAHSRRIFLEELDREWASIDLATVRDERGARQIVGYCNYWLVRDEVHLLNIATRSDAQRRGHAAHLLEHLVQFAVRRQCRYITLEVRRSNHAAIALYKCFDFEPVGVRPKYYVEDNEDALVMLREL